MSYQFCPIKLDINKILYHVKAIRKDVVGIAGSEPFTVWTSHESMRVSTVDIPVGLRGLRYNCMSIKTA